MNSIIKKIMKTATENHEIQTKFMDSIMKKTEDMNDATHDCVNFFMNNLTMAFVNIRTMLEKDKVDITQIELLNEAKQSVIETQYNIFDMEDLQEWNEQSQQAFQKMKKNLMQASVNITSYLKSMK